MKTLILNSVFLVFFVVLFQNFISAQDLADAIYKTKAQQYDEATEILNNLIKKSPTNGELYFYKGEVYLKSYIADTFSVSLKETSDLATPVFNEGVKMDSTSCYPYIGLGHLAMLNKDYSKAYSYFNKAKSFLPKYNLRKIKKIKDPKSVSTVLMKIGESQILQGISDTVKILPLLREAELIDPGNAEIYLVAGDAYISVNDGSRAISCYSKAQSLMPNSPAANIKKGYLYIACQNYAVALPYLEEALKTDPNYAPVYRELGKLYNLSGKYDMAKKYYAKYMQLSGNNIPAKIRYISSLFFSKDYDEAIKQIEDVLAVNKSYPYLYRLAAYSYFDKKVPDYKKAQSYIEELFKTVKEDNLITKDYIYHGHIILNMHNDFIKLYGDTLRLNAEYNKYVDLQKNGKKSKDKLILQPKIDSINNQIMLVCKKIKEDSLEIAKGFGYLITAYNKEGKNIVMANHIASLYNSFRQYSNAAEWYQKKIELSKQPNINDFISVGTAYYKGKMLDQAIEAFTKVTEMDSHFIPGFFMLANACSEKDPDSKLGLAKPKYELLIEKAINDPVKNKEELNVAYSYLGSYYLFIQKDYDLATSYFDKLILLEPSNNATLIKAYTSLAYLNSLKKDYAKAKYYYSEIHKIDPKNEDAKKNMEYYSKLK